jgi:hypothetical protein
VSQPTCSPLPDGNVQITGSGVMTAHEASLLIVEIAKAATQAQRRSGQALPDATGATAPVPYIEATAMGLDPQSPKDGYILLSLFFGAAQIGIAIAKSDGTQLGQALIAGCSDETTSH